MSKWHGGKGSKRRPEDKKKFDSEWDRIFGKKKEQPKPERANWYGEADVDEDEESSSEFAHPAYTRYPHLKDLEKALDDLKGEIEGKKNDD